MQPRPILTLLRQRGVIDDQPGLVTADQLGSLPPQIRFQRRAIPDACADKMVQPVIAAARAAMGWMLLRSPSPAPASGRQTIPAAAQHPKLSSPDPSHRL